MGESVAGAGDEVIEDVVVVEDQFFVVLVEQCQGLRFVLTAAGVGLELDRDQSSDNGPGRPRRRPAGSAVGGSGTEAGFCVRTSSTPLSTSTGTSC